MVLRYLVKRQVATVSFLQRHVAARGARQQIVDSFYRLASSSSSTTTGTGTTGTTVSSFFEPYPTLFPTISQIPENNKNDNDDNLLDSKAKTDDIDDAPLRSDVRMMGSLLGNIIQEHQGEQIFQYVERLRRLAKRWRDAGAGRGDANQIQESKAIFQELTSFVSSLSNSDLFWVSRAFTHFLAIANSAEGHHRGRSILAERPQIPNDIHALPHKPDSCGGLLPQLLRTQENPHTKQEIWNALVNQKVQLVLTSHPTEVNRKTILDKQKRVHKILTTADRIKNATTTTHKNNANDDIPVSSYVQNQLNQALEREISSIWQSDEVARQKPTPQDEAGRGTLIVETVLWEAVPKFLRKLDATMVEHLDRGLPLSSAPITFASWMGGDRDGNPNVTPPVTREVCMEHRYKAANLFRRDLQRLQEELSVTHCSDELMQQLISKTTTNNIREPYRKFLEPIIHKLETTAEWAKTNLQNIQRGNQDVSFNMQAIDNGKVYLNRKELMDDLVLMHKSLSTTGNQVIADGALTDIIRNLAAFGLTLVPLDVRQESDRHMQAMDAITRFLGLGSYEQWDEETKISWLQQQLASKRPLIRPYIWREHPNAFTPTDVDALETFQMIAQQHSDSLGAYVISQATSASDVLSVLLLQRDAGVKKPLRVVPLFETLDDLNGATTTMESLFSLPAYMGSIGGKQEIMIGYSDSAKDAGRLAASWAQYETQEKLADLAKKYGVELTFFHGKGGTVGRGGNPATFKAILAHAPDTIHGRFRVTEQGEMIQKNFGHSDRAERTMDIYTAAVLAEQLTPRSRPTQEWRDMMGTLSDISCREYRRIVREDERFVPYFRSATPEVELSNLNIGSRPAKRKATGGVESLRAIPWIFAWTQTRLNLPTWLGVGKALNQVLQQSEEADKLRDMYENWGSFQTTIHLVEMVLAKSEPAIAQHYDKELVHDAKAHELSQEIQSIHAATEDSILQLTQHESLTANNPLLARALRVRNPYVDCLNVLQVETLKRIREAEGKEEEEDNKVLKDALMTTITGIANGMGNTG